MKERKIKTIGHPNLDALTKTESKIFYSTLLSAVIVYYKDKDNISKNYKEKQTK